MFASIIYQEIIALEGLLILQSSSKFYPLK